MDDCTSFELDAVQRRQTPPYGAVQPGITVARPARRAADTVAVPLLANLSSETRMATRNRYAPRDVAREAGRGHERGGGPAVGRPLDAPAPAPDRDRAWCPSASDTVPSPPGALPRELEAPSVGGETAQLATHTRMRVRARVRHALRQAPPLYAMIGVYSWPPPCLPPTGRISWPQRRRRRRWLFLRLIQSARASPRRHSGTSPVLPPSYLAMPPSM